MHTMHIHLLSIYMHITINLHMYPPSTYMGRYIDIPSIIYRQSTHQKRTGQLKNPSVQQTNPSPGMSNDVRMHNALQTKHPVSFKVGMTRRPARCRLEGNWTFGLKCVMHSNVVSHARAAGVYL